MATGFPSRTWPQMMCECVSATSFSTNVLAAVLPSPFVAAHLQSLCYGNRYQLMVSCWHGVPQARLSFTQLQYSFKSIVAACSTDAATNYITVEPDDNYAFVLRNVPLGDCTADLTNALGDSTQNLEDPFSDGTAALTVPLGGSTHEDLKDTLELRDLFSVSTQDLRHPFGDSTEDPEVLLGGSTEYPIDHFIGNTEEGSQSTPLHEAPECCVTAGSSR